VLLLTFGVYWHVVRGMAAASAHIMSPGMLSSSSYFCLYVSTAAASERVQGRVLWHWVVLRLLLRTLCWEWAAPGLGCPWCYCCCCDLSCYVSRGQLLDHPEINATKMNT
jgi:hypothetical protein